MLMHILPVVVSLPIATGGIQRDDPIIFDQEQGALLSFDMNAGVFRPVFSGADVLNNPPGVATPTDVGGGPALGRSVVGAMESGAGREVYIGRSNSGDGELFAIDVFTGDRRLLSDDTLLFPGTDDPVWLSVEWLGFDSAERLIVLTSRSVFAYDIATGGVELLSSRERGIGPMFRAPRNGLLINDSTLLVSDDFSTNVLFSIDLVTGERSIVSWLDQSVQADWQIFNDPNAAFPPFLVLTPDDFGPGPVTSNNGPSDIGMLDGVVYASGVGVYDNGPQLFEGGVVRVDLSDGGREFVFGTVFESVTSASVGPVIRRSPSNAPGYLFEKGDNIVGAPDGRLWFNDRFVTLDLQAYDPATDGLETVADLVPQLAPGWTPFLGGTDGSRLRIRDIAFYRGTVCSADLDGDGDVDLGDFGAFAASFGSTTGDERFDAKGDLDRDGDVDLGDFGAFGLEFGRADCLD